MQLKNLTGRTVYLNPVAYGQVAIPPEEDGEWFGTPTSDTYEELITVDGVRVIGQDETHIESGLTFKVKQRVQIANTYLPVPPPTEGIGYIVQSNVAEMYPERRDLFIATDNGTLWRETNRVRTTDRHLAKAIVTGNRQLRDRTEAALQQEARRRLAAFTVDKSKLAVSCADGLTIDDLRAFFADEDDLTSQ